MLSAPEHCFAHFVRSEALPSGSSQILLATLAPPLRLGAATLDGPIIVFNNNIDHVDTLEIEMNVIWISSLHMLFSNWEVGNYLELNNVS